MAPGWDAECAVVGGGPAGLLSALYLARFRRSVILFDHGLPRASWIPETHNLLGFPEGISGRELLKRLHAHLEKYPVRRVQAQARVDLAPSGFRISCPGKDESFLVRKVILATGVRDRRPPLENIAKLHHTGRIRYCPICDAYDFSGKRLVVLLGTRPDLAKAFFLSHFSRDLVALAPPDSGFGSREVRLAERAGITLRIDRLVAIDERAPPPGLRVTTASGPPIECDVLYVEMGSEVKDIAFRHLEHLKRTPDGAPVVDSEQRTSIPGLFGAGDCVSELYQIVVGAGQAAVAATACHSDLSEEDGFGL